MEADYGNAAGSRHYYVYTPPGDPAGRPLVVWLHGCAVQDPDMRDDLAGDYSARLARELGFVLVVPIQPLLADPLGCWNWFDPADQHRDAGEPSILAGITRSVLARYHLDRRRVYLVGHSDGGLMVNIMAAAYPDLYTAISAWCTGPYRGTDLTGAAAHAAMGPRSRPLPVLLVEDRNDPLSSPLVGRLALRQWLGTDKLALGLPDCAVPTPISVRHRPADPAEGFADPAELETYRVGPVQVRYLTIEGGDHNLDGDARGAYRSSLLFLIGYRMP